MNLNWKIIIGGLGAALAATLLGWWLLSGGPTGGSAEQSNNTLGTADTRSTVTASGTEGSDTSGAAVQLSNQKVFKISNGPVAGATFIETLRPTTTLARFVMQTNGHVFDLMLDSPGAIARAISNTTIPGIAQVVWARQGRVALAQYVAEGVVKTLSLTFPATSSTSATAVAGTSPVALQFLPNNISLPAISPNETNIAYLVGTGAGSDGYTASPDGSGAKKVFTLPLTQMVLSWPSPTLLLVVSKPATDVPGIAFSVNTSSGAKTPLLYGPGLTAITDTGFTKLLYQTSSAAGGRLSYLRDIKAGHDTPLSFDPFPTRCRLAGGSIFFCALPLNSLPSNYLDLWHVGATREADAIFTFSLQTGTSSIVAIPGGRDGGEESDILELLVSKDGRYLLFIRKGDRSLWGVRLDR